MAAASIWGRAGWGRGEGERQGQGWLVDLIENFGYLLNSKNILDSFVHLLGGEVAVCAGAVPVAHHGLGVHGDDHAELLGDAVQQEAAHPEVVAHRDALAGAHLELPLKGKEGERDG